MSGKNAVGPGYSAPKHKSTLGGAGPMTSGMSAGVADGLSSHSSLDTSSAVMPVSSDGSHAGFSTARRQPRDSTSAKKNGKTFNIER
jgi:hypothetical protein